MTCKRWRLLSWGISLVGIVFFLAGFLPHMSLDLLSGFGVLVMFAGMVLHGAKFRCPACGRHISDRVPVSITHCPFCGEALEPSRCG